MPAQPHHDRADGTEPARLVQVARPQSDRATKWKRHGALTQVSQQPGSEALSTLPYVALGIDLFMVSVALVVGIASHVLVHDSTGFAPSIDVAAPALAIVWVLSIYAAGGYERQVFGAGPGEFNRVLHASLAAGAVMGVGAFMLDAELSRWWYGSTMATGLPLLLLGRAAMRFWLKRARAGGHLQQRVVLVGGGAHVERVHDVLARETWLGYQVIGALADVDEGACTASGIPILGDTSDVAGRALAAHADVVVFAGGSADSPDGMRDLAYQLEGTGIQVVVAPSLSDVSARRVRIRPVGGLPLIHLEQPRADLAVRRAKRTFDVVGAAALLLAFLPVLAFAAVRVRAHDRGPVLFRQERVGRDGTPFGCFKFRTMVVDAEAKLAEVHAAQGSDSNTMFYKLTHDPRITPPGRWLRRFSIDELPQLINVIRGEMSLVGPRPQVAHEVARYDRVTSRRLHVRPGMTGLWQISGRSDLPLEEAIRLDVYYVDNWSMMADIAILMRTFSAVLSSRGAY